MKGAMFCIWRVAGGVTWQIGRRLEDEQDMRCAY